MIHRIAATVHELQEQSSAASSENWWRRARDWRTQVCCNTHARSTLSGISIFNFHDLSHRHIVYAYRPSLRRLVLETLELLPDDRKCFRMINGVLVERTVKDVIPALKTNSEGLKKVLEELLKQYKKQQDEMEKWKVFSPTQRHRYRMQKSLRYSLNI